MKLIDNWQKIAKHAWSVKFSLLAALLSGAEVLMTLLTPTHPSVVFAICAALLCVAAVIARVIAQPKLWK